MERPFPREFALGPTKVIAPLYFWGDGEVLRAVSYEPFADEVTMCSKCYESLAGWDRASSLDLFSKRFKEAA